DADGTSPTFSITGGADSGKFSINSTSGVLTFSAAPDYEAPTDADSNNTYIVEVTASDGTNTDVQTITVTVTDVNDAPVITSDGGGAAAGLNVAENQTAVTTVAASDDEDTPTFSITGGADQAKFSIDTNTGVLTFVAAPDFETPTDSDTDNIYIVEVTADDGNGGTDIQTITVAVTNVNEAPVITSDGGSATAGVNVAENQTAVTTVTATDVDTGDTLTYYKVSGPAWLNVAEDGTLSGTPTGADVGLNTWTVRVEDGNGGVTTAQLEITVDSGGGSGAVIDFDPSGEAAAQLSGAVYSEASGSGLDSSIALTLANSTVSTFDGTLSKSVIFANAGDAITVGAFFNMSAFGTGTDTSGQILRLGLTKGSGDSFSGLPFSSIILTGTAGSGTANFAERQSGSYDTDTFALSTGQWYYFETTFTYDGGTAVDYDMAVYNASGDGSIGSVVHTWTTAQTEANPELDDGVALYAGFRGSSAFDNGAAGIMDNFKVVTGNGTPSNNAPSFTSDPINEIFAEEDIAYSSSIADDASDLEGDPMTFSKVSGPAWLSVAADGTLSGTPGAGDVGLNTFTVQVDADGGSDTATLNITVYTTPDIYQAEDATMVGPEFGDSTAGWTGTGYADFKNNSGDYIEWTVTVASDGVYDLSFRYALDSGDRPLEIQVNGQVVDSSQSFPATGGWSIWDMTAPLSVTLNAGANTVRATAIGSGGGNIDNLAVYSAPAGNNAPSFASDPINEISATENAVYSSSIADDASDPEGDSMTFSKVSGPAWLAVAADGTLSGRPGSGDVGLNTFTVQVIATGGSDTATLNITVITGLLTSVTAEADTFVIKGIATENYGADEVIRTKTISGTTTRVSILRFDTTTLGDLSGGINLELTKADASAFTTDKTVYVYGVTDGSALQNFVEGTGTQAVATTDGLAWNDSLAFDTAYTYDIKTDAGYFYDYDAAGVEDPLASFTVATTDAAGTTYRVSSEAMTAFANASTDQYLTFVLVRDLGAENYLNLTWASREHATYDAPTLSITSNTAPVFASDPITKPNATEGFTYCNTIASIAADTDADVPTFTITGGADQAKFSVDLDSGVLTFNAAPDYETPTDADSNNTYIVEVTASDGNGGTDIQTITVTVTNENDNDPVITSDGGGATAGVNAAENQTAVTTVTATDADSTSPTFSITGGADSGKFSINSTSGVLTFSAAPDYETPTDADSNNTYIVEVTASDGTNTDVQTITVTVTNENDNDPVITSDGGGATAGVNAAENQTAVTTVTATDADGTSPTFSITGGADSGKFSINSTSGVLTFSAASDYEAPTDADSNNTYIVEVTASDGTNTDIQTITVTVTNENDNNPVITSSDTVNAAENQT
ncbi:MAG: cadherin domain-containing protein, partial [Planctomycetota bacterium]